MNPLYLVLVLATGVIAGAAGGYYSAPPTGRAQFARVGAPESPLPTSGVVEPGARKLLYYRNPMGLPDISPVPKKDSMGMDYIPVHEGEEPSDLNSIKVSQDKIQRSGVRTEVVEARVLVNQVRAVGTVKYDERRLAVVTMRSEGYVEELFVKSTGQFVQAGEPLFRVYSRDIQVAQIDLTVANGMQGRTVAGLRDLTAEGSMQRLRNLGVPESRIDEVRTKGTFPRTLDWPSPATGTVIDKRIVSGQRVMPGDELYRIADLSQLWVIAEVAEFDLAAIKLGTVATVTLRAYPFEPIEGAVTFIYPDLRAETRTARVRIEVPNPEGRLKIDMYADVAFRAGADQDPVVAVPDSAVIDSGTRRIVLVAKGDGRFEPRPVKLGIRGEGYVEIREGVNEGESVVTSATFLIDSESNLNAALKAFMPQVTSP
jgi:membrane fusion protein, copper/silver efflux system